MSKHFLIVDEDQPEKARPLLGEEFQEILDGVLVELIGNNQGEQNLIEFLEARLIQLALEQARYNKSRAARQLGMQRKRLERRVRKYADKLPIGGDRPRRDETEAS